MGQGTGVEELLGVFEALRLEHEKTDADRFNDDDFFKTVINKVKKKGRFGGSA